MPRTLKVRSLYDTFDPGERLPDLTVRPEPDGTIRADAAHAELLGGLVLERNERANVGNWSREKDSVEWRVADPRAGKYRLSITLASPEGGSRVEISVGTRRREVKVPRTGAWTSYTRLDLGEVDLDGAPFRIAVRPLEKHGSHVMNLRSVELVPSNR